MSIWTELARHDLALHQVGTANSNAHLLADRLHLRLDHQLVYHEIQPMKLCLNLLIFMDAMESQTQVPWGTTNANLWHRGRT